MAVIGVTAKIEHEGGSGYVEVPNCKAINFPGFNITSVDTTNLGNSDYAKTYIPGMIDASTITVDCEYTAVTYNDLQALVREVKSWRVTAPAGEDVVVTCDGFITKLDVKPTPDEEVMINFEIKMTGLPVVS